MSGEIYVNGFNKSEIRSKLQIKIIKGNYIAIVYELQDKILIKNELLHNLRLVFEIFEKLSWSRLYSTVRHPIYRLSWNGEIMTSSFWYHVTEVIVGFYLGVRRKVYTWMSEIAFVDSLYFEFKKD